MIMSRTIVLAALSALSALPLAGCGSGGQNGVATLTPGALTAHPVDWNPEKTDVGKVFAVTDIGGTAAVFTEKGMNVVIAGAVNATDGSVTGWESAGVIPAADGEGEWLIGVDDQGQLYSVDALSELAKVSDRFGLAADHVHEVAAISPIATAFRLDGQIAIADGATVTRYTLPLTSLAGGGGRIAGVSSGAIHLFDVTKGMDSSFELEEAAFATFDAKGKVVAATKTALYMEDDKGGLSPLVDLSDTAVHGLANSPSGVWVAMGTELGLLANGKFNATKGLALPADAKLIGSSSGDVWALSANTLSRYSATPPGDESLWNMTVQPVFTRVCSACHLPGGTANTDLSYYGAWVERRQLISQRVIDKTPTPMPPTASGVNLSTDDLAAIQAWVQSGAGGP